MNRIRLQFACIVGIYLFGSDLALGWGQNGHRLVNEAAIEITEGEIGYFLKINALQVAKLAEVPDMEWKNGATGKEEKPYHFFHWDEYSRSVIADQLPLPLRNAVRALGADTLQASGLAMWRIGQLYELLVQALKDGKWSQAAQFAGVIGHYVADIHQPMHMTSDYDGQSIGRKGIHRHYETTVLNRQERRVLFEDVVQEASSLPDQTTDPSPAEVIGLNIAQGKEAFIRMTQLLEIYRESAKPADDVLVPLLTRDLGAAARALATVWQMAANEAGLSGVQLPEQEINIQSPRWIRLPLSP